MSGSEFTKTHFSHPTEFEGRLDELAKEYYNDNKSHLIRAAVSDHKQTLEGNDEFAIKSLETKVDKLAEEIEELSEFAQTSKPPRSSNTANHEEEDDEIDPISVQRSVQDLLIDEGPHSLEDIVQVVDEGSLAIRGAIDTLIERDYVSKTSEEADVQYQISV